MSLDALRRTELLLGPVRLPPAGGSSRFHVATMRLEVWHFQMDLMVLSWWILMVWTYCIILFGRLLMFIVEIAVFDVQYMIFTVDCVHIGVLKTTVTKWSILWSKYGFLTQSQTEILESHLGSSGGWGSPEFDQLSDSRRPRLSQHWCFPREARSQKTTETKHAKSE